LLKSSSSSLEELCTDELTIRLSDHITILATLESNLKIKTSTGTASWDLLSEQDQTTKNDGEKVLTSILRLHSTLIDVHTESGHIHEYPILFWTSISILNVPCDIFPNLYELALDNCCQYLRGVRQGNLNNLQSSFHEYLPKLKRSFRGLQPLLLQGLFGNGKIIQQKSFELLLSSWELLPEAVVDPSTCGLLYTTLYSITYLFTMLYEIFKMAKSKTDSTELESIMFSLQERLHSFIFAFRQVLYLKKPTEFKQTCDVLTQILDGDAPIDPDLLLQTCIIEFSKNWFPDTIHNIVDWLVVGIKIPDGAQDVVLKMTRIFWEIGGYKNNSFKSFIKVCINKV